MREYSSTTTLTVHEIWSKVVRNTVLLVVHWGIELYSTVVFLVVEERRMVSIKHLCMCPHIVAYRAQTYINKKKKKKQHQLLN